MKGARVLVVDDDPMIREFVDTVLTGDGFEAVLVEDGVTALQALASDRYDLLLTDLRMPGIDGFRLVARARTSHPDLRVLFMSGYAEEYRIDPMREDFVPKPFRPRELLGCVYEILGRAAERRIPE